MRGKILEKSVWLCLIVLLLAPVSVKAAEEKTKDMYLESFEEKIDYSEIDIFLEEWSEGKEKIRFSDLVKEMLQQDGKIFENKKIFDWIYDAFWYEISANRKLLLEIVALAIGFSILRNFSNAFRSAYVSDLCFLLVYCVLAVLLLQSFLAFRDIVAEVLKDSVSFMQALVPAFSVAMVFSTGVATTAGFYQIAFLAVYVIQWLFLQILFPCIHVYVLVELFNHFFEDEKFQNLAGLLRGFICWGMKIAMMAVLGLNAVQSLILPAKDRLTRGTIQKAATVIPGIGNVVNGVSELLLGSGILLKNCVGVAGVVVLVLIGIVPVVKVACMTLFYKLAAAITEPVSDPRIAGCLKGMAEGGVIYLKLMTYSLVLFLLTIALTTAASGFMY